MPGNRTGFYLLGADCFSIVFDVRFYAIRCLQSKSSHVRTRSIQRYWTTSSRCSVPSETRNLSNMQHARSTNAPNGPSRERTTSINASLSGSRDTIYRVSKSHTVFHDLPVHFQLGMYMAPWNPHDKMHPGFPRSS